MEISCTVTYKDKTTETKKIKVSPKTGKVSDLALKSEKAGPKDDLDIVYTVYSIK